MDQLKSSNNKENPADQETHSSVPPASEESISSASEKNNTISYRSENKSYHKQKINWPTWIMAGATVVIMFITLFYMIAAWKQVNQMIAQHRIDQRAWVGITHIVATGEVGKPTSISVGIKNTGKTPAINTNTIMRVDIIKWDIEPNFANIQHSPEESKGVFAPQQDATIAYDLAERNMQITDVQSLGIISGSMRVVFYGIITYDDIFGFHHWLKYCAYLKGDGKSFVYYHEHNRTDDN